MVDVIDKFTVKKVSTIFFALIILMALGLSGPVLAENGVIVTGQADINSDRSLARDEALEDAFLKAVQKSIGTYINRSVQVADYQLINASTYSKVEGFISDYEIINEGADDAGEVYQVEIMAEVKPAALDELDDISFVLETQTSNPRIYVDLDGKLQKTLHDELQELGFMTVEPGEVVGNSPDIVISGEFELENLPDYPLRRGPLKVRQDEFATEEPARQTEYTGLIVDARNVDLKPQVRFRIEDEDEDVVYASTKALYQPAIDSGLVNFAHSVEQAKEDSRMGDNPMVVQAIDTAGENDTVAVVSNSEGSRIRSELNETEVFRETKVMVIIDE